jgi:hypothetical protein
MNFFNVNTDLSRGDLSIIIRDLEGRTLDALKVTYSIFDTNCTLVSGRDLSSINYYDGVYYAPYRTVNPGTYVAKWFVNGSEIYSTNFYVAQSGQFTIVDGQVKPASLLPDPSSKTYVVGYVTSVDDLALYIKNEYCELVDADNVRYRILRPDGCVVVDYQVASRAGVGHYFVIWIVNGLSGTYSIEWNYTDPFTGITSAPSMKFNVFCPQPVANVSNVGHNCGCHCKPACYPGLCGVYNSCAGSCGC